jgi:HicB-like protein involved in pilus formation
VNHYTYRVGWSPHHGEYSGSCVEMPFLRREAPTAQEATAAIEAAVDEHVAAMQGCGGDTPPMPIADRSYSGTIVVRTSSELHRRLALEAAEERVSMNQWVVQKLSGRRPSDGWGLSGFD